MYAPSMAIPCVVVGTPRSWQQPPARSRSRSLSFSGRSTRAPAKLASLKPARRLLRGRKLCPFFSKFQNLPVQLKLPPTLPSQPQTLPHPLRTAYSHSNLPKRALTCPHSLSSERTKQSKSTSKRSFSLTTSAAAATVHRSFPANLRTVHPLIEV